MRWRGFARAMNRAAVRNQRELQRQQKMVAKMQEAEKAAYEVQVYQNHIDLLLSVHKECGETYDWAEIGHSEPPAKPERLNQHEDAARLDLSSLKIGLSDKLLGRGDSKRRQLLDAIEDAKNLDEKEYQDALTSYQNEYDEWQTAKELSTKILAGDKVAYIEAIKKVDPFSDINGLGSSYRINVDSKATLTTTLHVNGHDALPTEVKTLTKSEKVSIKPMPKNRFYEIYQDYVCGCSLRVARELFALLPIDMVTVNAIGSLLNKQTGHLEDTPILSVAIPRKTFDMLNFENLDPSDSLKNFVHNMDFKKGKGFGPVKVLDSTIEQKSNEVIQLSQDNSEAPSITLLKTSLALLKDGKYDEAFNACEEAIRIDPQFSLAWQAKGLMLCKQGLNEEALKAFDEAIKLNQSYAEAWHYKGIALKSLDRSAEGDTYLAKAKDLGYEG
jgi:tetratricopeptide (TPR) repeat protein